jgi:hypothetical protein
MHECRSVLIKNTRKFFVRHVFDTFLTRFAKAGRRSGKWAKEYRVLDQSSGVPVRQLFDLPVQWDFGHVICGDLKDSMHECREVLSPKKSKLHRQACLRHASDTVFTSSHIALNKVNDEGLQCWLDEDEISGVAIGGIQGSGPPLQDQRYLRD